MTMCWAADSGWSLLKGRFSSLISSPTHLCCLEPGRLRRSSPFHRSNMCIVPLKAGALAISGKVHCCVWVHFNLISYHVSCLTPSSSHPLKYTLPLVAQVSHLDLFMVFVCHFLCSKYSPADWGSGNIRQHQLAGWDFCGSLYCSYLFTLLTNLNLFSGWQIHAGDMAPNTPS